LLFFADYALIYALFDTGRKAESHHESSQFSSSHMRKLPHCSPQGRGARHLHQSTTQTASGLTNQKETITCRDSWVWTFRARSTAASRSVISTVLDRNVRMKCLPHAKSSLQRRRMTSHLIQIGSYRGLRHKKGLPVRGQRTKTNAKTRKGNRKASSAAIRGAAPKK